MRTVAADVPKALIPVGGVPFLFHQLRWLEASGVDDVVLCVGFGARAIAQAVAQAQPLGLRVRFSDDGERLRGTGGSIAHALPLLAARFLTVYGDSLLTCDLQSIAREFESSADTGLMTVLHNDDRWLRSNVRVQGDRVVAYDKQAAAGTMTHIDYGLNAFAAEAFRDVDPFGTTDLAVVHHALVGRRRLRAYQVHSRFYEIGSPEGLAETETFLAAQTANGVRTHEHL